MYFRTITPRIYTFSLAVLFTTLSLISSSLPVHAEPVTDIIPPILKPSIVNGEQRNIITFTLDVADESPVSASIEVVGVDDRPLEPRQFASNLENSKNVVLQWNTADADDGDYKVKYSAVDARGLEVQEMHSFKVVNKQPLVTMRAAADGRTIGGTVSRSDGVFQVKIDGTVVELSPTILQVPDKMGSYDWTLTLPDSITDGSHVIELVVTSSLTGGVSAPVSNTVSITTPLKVSEASTSTVLPPVISISDYAKEVGQFIAPILPVVPQTKLFGVSTTDITQDAAPNQDTALVPSRASKVSYVGDVSMQKDTNSAPIATSESGWMFFGVAWYWWLAMGSVVIAVLALSVRAMRRLPRTAYFGAESA